LFYILKIAIIFIEPNWISAKKTPKNAVQNTDLIMIRIIQV